MTRQRPIWRIAVVVMSALLVCLFVFYRAGTFRTSDSMPAPVTAETTVDDNSESPSPPLFPSSKRGTIAEPLKLESELGEIFYSSKSGMIIRADDLTGDEDQDTAVEEPTPEP